MTDQQPKRGRGRPRIHATPQDLNRHKQRAFRQRRAEAAGQHAAALDQLARTAALTLTQQRTIQAAAEYLAELSGAKEGRG